MSDIPKIWRDEAESERFHYHMSRHSHGRSFPKADPDYASFHCYGETDLECRLRRTEFELTCMMQCRLQELGEGVAQFVIQHEKEHPEDWRPQENDLC